ncbi:hypothetical protein J4G08_21865, partial [Candidatus Poribacteria bacterium]|nr:hypothetical protein [Candidatus Poribacteria bacterium]
MGDLRQGVPKQAQASMRIWTGQGIAQVIQYHWTDKSLNTKEETHKVHYGITSLKPAAASAERLLTGRRGHWSIENKSHW